MKKNTVQTEFFFRLTEKEEALFDFTHMSLFNCRIGKLNGVVKDV